ncbi:hypothetical protein MBLNU230_g0664t1 [Neophaeotheca triangularis]
MYLARFLYALLSTTASLANPVGHDTRTTGEVLADFDDLSGIPAVPLLTDIDTYRNLQFRALQLVQAGILGQVVVGVDPASGTNYAAHGLVDELTGVGQARIEPTDAVPFFRVQSLFFACVANTLASLVGLPTACSVAFTGFRGGEPVATRTVQFNPGFLIFSDMQFVEFGGELGKGKFDRFELSVVSSPLGNALTALLVDSVRVKQFAG